MRKVICLIAVLLMCLTLVLPAAAAGDGITKTAILRERKRDRKQSAYIRELKAAVKKPGRFCVPYLNGTDSCICMCI